ncbi:hypothetical protein ACFCV3_32205 [Kribbella sp. NPDC056345]|uniref:hypothetical protein n=1 Tax=Kribbella sp. NPDC056345 TaxID=3345789 RepID=UPI0035D621AF
MTQAAIEGSIEMADVSCAHCAKSWDTKYLRREMSWFECVDCGARIVKFRDGTWQNQLFPWQGSAGNCTHPLGGDLHWNDSHSAGVPSLIAESSDPEAWFEVVVADLGCPECGLHEGKQLSGPGSVGWIRRLWRLGRQVGKAMR